MERPTRTAMVLYLPPHLDNILGPSSQLCPQPFGPLSIPGV